jgi:hypothetical protein
VGDFSAVVLLEALFDLLGGSFDSQLAADSLITLQLNAPRNLESQGEGAHRPGRAGLSRDKVDLAKAASAPALILLRAA